MTMLERVARAIQEADCADKDCEGAANGYPDDISDWGVHVARAAIEAMAAVVDGRAPTTHEMAEAFERKYKEHSQKHGHYESFNAAFRAAIDAALSPARDHVEGAKG